MAFRQEGVRARETRGEKGEMLRYRGSKGGWGRAIF